MSGLVLSGVVLFCIVLDRVGLGWNRLQCAVCCVELLSAVFGLGWHAMCFVLGRVVVHSVLLCRAWVNGRMGQNTKVTRLL